MTKAIIMCYCDAMEDQASAAYKTIFHTEELPKIYKGKYEISALRAELSRTSGNVKDYLLAMQKSSKKFAYYMEWDDAGVVTSQYSLVTGKKLI